VGTPIALYLLALAARLVLIAAFPDPAYPDSYYYVEVARSLAAGQGLSVDFVWIFAEVGNRIPAEPTLPIPSNAHWLPLASFLQAPFIALLGPTAFASALPMVLVGSLAAPLAWLIGREAGTSRIVAVGAGILAAVPAAGTVFMAQPENFALLAPLVAATLWLAARGLKGDARAYALAGLLAGLASLARNDGFLLAGAIGLLFVGDRARTIWSRGAISPRIPFVAAVGAAALYLLIMGPWWARQIAEFGSMSPTASGGSALWIRTISEWNSITAEPSLEKFMAQGWGAIAESRALGFIAAVANFVVVIGSIILVPFMAVGLWLRRRSVDFMPWITYTAVVFAGATLLYPLHVPGGAFIHSAVGLAPHAYVLALEGVVGMVAWFGGRRGWHLQSAIPVFVAATILFTIGTAAWFGAGTMRTWDTVRQPRQALAAALDGLGVGPDDRLFSIDSAGYSYFTGRPGVVTPNDPMATIEAVARAYEMRWLILERSNIVRELAPLLLGARGPEWIGGAVFEIPSSDGGPAVLALYPICLEASDRRCGAESAAP
jgi:hypothetical protein